MLAPDPKVKIKFWYVSKSKVLLVEIVAVSVLGIFTLLVKVPVDTKETKVEFAPSGSNNSLVTPAL